MEFDDDDTSATVNFQSLDNLMADLGNMIASSNDDSLGLDVASRPGIIVAPKVPIPVS